MKGSSCGDPLDKIKPGMGTGSRARQGEIVGEIEYLVASSNDSGECK